MKSVLLFLLGNRVEYIRPRTLFSSFVSFLNSLNFELCLTIDHNFEWQN